MSFNEYLIERILNEKEFHDLVSDWDSEPAKEYATKLIENLGEPDHDMSSMGEMWWFDKAGFDRIIIKDEKIEHKFPSPHLDFVYSTKGDIELSKEQAAALNHATGSIMVDQLKGEVTARCGALPANAITIGFAEDVANGDWEDLSPEAMKTEYARRIKSGETPSWFEGIGD